MHSNTRGDGNRGTAPFNLTLDTHVKLVGYARDKDFNFLRSEILLSPTLPPQHEILPHVNGYNIFDMLFANEKLSHEQRGELILNCVFQRGYKKFYQTLLQSVYLDVMLNIDEELYAKAYGNLIFTLYSMATDKSDSFLLTGKELKIYVMLLKAGYDPKTIFEILLQNENSKEQMLKVFVLFWFDQIKDVGKVLEVFNYLAQAIKDTRFADAQFDIHKYAKNQVINLGGSDPQILEREDVKTFLAEHRNSFWSGGWGSTTSTGILALFASGETDEAMKAYRAESARVLKTLSPPAPPAPSVP